MKAIVSLVPHQHQLSKTCMNSLRWTSRIWGSANSDQRTDLEGHGLRTSFVWSRTAIFINSGRWISSGRLFNFQVRIAERKKQAPHSAVLAWKSRSDFCQSRAPGQGERGRCPFHFSLISNLEYGELGGDCTWAKWCCFAFGDWRRCFPADAHHYFVCRIYLWVSWFSIFWTLSIDLI